jgi:hypothetical protein
MKGRRDSGSYSKLPHAYFESAEYAELADRAVKALVDLLCQYRGNNNGDLTAAWSIMSKRGWTSKSKLAKAIAELLAYGWIIVSRQSTKRREPTLYAITFLSIDPCGGKLDIAANPVPLNLWKRERRAEVVALPRSSRRVRKKSLALDTGQPAPPHGAMKVAV